MPFVKFKTIHLVVENDPSDEFHSLPFSFRFLLKHSDEFVAKTSVKNLGLWKFRSADGVRVEQCPSYGIFLR